MCRLSFLFLSLLSAVFKSDPSRAGDTKDLQRLDNTKSDVDKSITNSVIFASPKSNFILHAVKLALNRVSLVAQSDYEVMPAHRGCEFNVLYTDRVPTSQDNCQAWRIGIYQRNLQI